jgi:pyrroline-5-carboxylate reductase
MAYESLRHLRLAFLGAGSIAETVIERLVKSGTIPRENILATDTRPERLVEMRQRFGIVVSPHNKDAISFGGFIFLSMPSLLVEAVLTELRGCLARDQLIISLVADVPTATIEDRLEQAVAVVRVVPSLPCIVGAGVIPYCLGKDAKPSDQARVVALLAVLGCSVKIREDQMNAATALTAYGPAYILPVIKTLIQACVRNGLTEDEARSVVARMVRGTAELVTETREDLDTLALKAGGSFPSKTQVCTLFTEAFETAIKELTGEEKKPAAAAA